MAWCCNAIHHQFEHRKKRGIAVVAVPPSELHLQPRFQLSLRSIDDDAIGHAQSPLAGEYGERTNQTVHWTATTTVLMIRTLAIGPASECWYVIPHTTMRYVSPKAIAVAALAASAAAGFTVRGWVGAFFWPLGLCGIVLTLGMAWFVIDLVVTYRRHRAKVERIRAEVRPLSNDQLRELSLDHSLQSSGFARVELMRRGLDARPPLEQLFKMLTSGNTSMCGQAMTYVSIFYPEMRTLVPLGSSNEDPPEVWQSRIAAVRGAI